MLKMEFFYIFFEREQWKIENKKYQPMSQKHQILHGSFRTRNLTPKKNCIFIMKTTKKKKITMLKIT